MARDPAPQSSIRAAARLANGFALDLVKLGGFGRDVIDGLLIMAITQSNVAQITRSPELQLRYATLDQPPPDELRRPVSLSAIANSLLIPFETVRRRVAALAELGVVQKAARGVIVPGAPLASPYYRIGAEAHYGLVRTLYVRLRGIGLLEDLPRAADSPFDPAAPPIRLVIRLSSDYALRLAEPLNRHIGDLVTGLVLMDMLHANTQHLADTEGGADTRAAGADDDLAWPQAGFVSDEARRGVRIAALSERLGIPGETVRRHVQRLLDADRCERKEDGFVVPARVLAREPFVRHMLDNQSHLHRLFSALADFGVLTEWDHQILSLRGAA